MRLYLEIISDRVLGSKVIGEGIIERASKGIGM